MRRQAAKYSRKRERDPSRIPAKKLLNVMCRKIRTRKIRFYVRGFIPRSSGLHDISKRYNIGACGTSVISCTLGILQQELRNDLCTHRRTWIKSKNKFSEHILFLFFSLVRV